MRAHLDLWQGHLRASAAFESKKAVMQENTQGAVIVISSHVMRGSVGNRAAVFALETLGYPVWAVPTIVMPWHPGHGPSTGCAFRTTISTRR